MPQVLPILDKQKRCKHIQLRSPWKVVLSQSSLDDEHTPLHLNEIANGKLEEKNRKNSIKYMAFLVLKQSKAGLKGREWHTENVFAIDRILQFRNYSYVELSKEIIGYCNRILTKLDNRTQFCKIIDVFFSRDGVSCAL